MRSVDELWFNPGLVFKVLAFAYVIANQASDLVVFDVVERPSLEDQLENSVGFSGGERTDSRRAESTYSVDEVIPASSARSRRVSQCCA